MLFSGILFLNSMTCFAANEKLSASSRQTLDQLIRSDNRLEKLSRQDKDLRLLVQCDEHTTENDLLECGVLSYVSLGNGFYTICISPSELSRFLDSDFVKRAELPRKASLSLDEARSTGTKRGVSFISLYRKECRIGVCRLWIRRNSPGLPLV